MFIRGPALNPADAIEGQPYDGFGAGYDPKTTDEQHGNRVPSPAAIGVERGSTHKTSRRRTLKPLARRVPREMR
jgi:hypothetical protein